MNDPEYYKKIIECSKRSPYHRLPGFQMDIRAEDHQVSLTNSTKTEVVDIFPSLPVQGPAEDPIENKLAGGKEVTEEEREFYARLFRPPTEEEKKEED